MISAEGRLVRGDVAGVVLCDEGDVCSEGLESEKSAPRMPPKNGMHGRSGRPPQATVLVTVARSCVK